MLRRAAVLLAVPATLALTASPAFAHQCVNASKNPTAGVQVVFDDSFTPVWVSKGLQGRIDRGLVDLESGEGFRGLIGIDFNGDGKADVTSYIVGPNGEIPVPAQMNGAECKGIVHFEEFLACQA